MYYYYCRGEGKNTYNDDIIIFDNTHPLFQCDTYKISFEYKTLFFVRL